MSWNSAAAARAGELLAQRAGPPAGAGHGRQVAVQHEQGEVGAAHERHRGVLQAQAAGVDDDAPLGEKSKTQVKRELHALQDLGERLAGLTRLLFEGNLGAQGDTV